MGIPITDRKTENANSRSGVESDNYIPPKGLIGRVRMASIRRDVLTQDDWCHIESTIAEVHALNRELKAAKKEVRELRHDVERGLDAQAELIAEADTLAEFLKRFYFEEKQFRDMHGEQADKDPLRVLLYEVEEYLRRGRYL